MKTAYSNGIIFTGKKSETGKAVLCNNGKVVALVAENAIPSGYTIKNLEGNYLAPAFIDMQIYGGNGKMFHEEPGIDSLKATYDYCRSGGCAFFMITIATNSLEVFMKGMEAVEAYWESGGKGLLGLHLEGPYINKVKRGAHIESFIKVPTIEEVQMMIDKGRGTFKMMTIAPECCDPQIVELLQEHKILVSAGHTNATYQEATAAFNNGIPVATHLFNAMSAFQHRAPGMVGAIFDHPSAMSSVVCDGVHADFSSVRIAKQIMKERLFYITDAVAETTGDYVHVFKGDHYELPDGTLSGSSLTMMQCVKNGVEQLGISLEESLRMASTYPAKFIRDKKLGVIAKGAEAVFVIFDGAYQVIEVVGV